ncbi:hypothetical protein [Cellulomonas sp. P24]|uniref:hypothetical protein n=1 Tax=Cellulomonas sp. P24 TaxID=2885206 RepID=UPI00216B22C5|nr:hypothetical protein [Cellulomonas sp. P24]MCR6491113.1 hypothetical protein [Cellulomonas sp. P24]
MSQPRLIVLEGVAGSGKSTLARYVGDLLERRGTAHHVVVEGDLNNPADHESTAWLSTTDYADLLEDHPGDAGPVRACAEAHEGGLLVPYGVLRETGQVAASTLDALARHDVYELPEQLYRRLALRRWRAFAEQAAAAPDVWVLDCCLLQNPITMLMVKHNCNPQTVREHIRAVVESVSALDPVVVQLVQDDIRATLDRAIAERPTAWAESFVGYHTQQAYGRDHSLQGLDGAVQVLTARRHLEDELLEELPVVTVRIDISGGWDNARSTLRAMIGQRP